MQRRKKVVYLHSQLGEMAEWSIAAVLKTVEGHTSGGSNPSLSARKCGLKFQASLFLWKNNAYLKSQPRRGWLFKYNMYMVNLFFNSYGIKYLALFVYDFHFKFCASRIGLDDRSIGIDDDREWGL